MLDGGWMIELMSLLHKGRRWGGGGMDGRMVKLWMDIDNDMNFTPQYSAWVLMLLVILTINI